MASWKLLGTESLRRSIKRGNEMLLEGPRETYMEILQPAGAKPRHSVGILSPANKGLPGRVEPSDAPCAAFQLSISLTTCPSATKGKGRPRRS
jgi:hypothetical protein